MNNDNPITRAHANMQRIACHINHLLRDHPELILGPPAFTPPDHPVLQDDATKRAYYHGYLPGDRVIIDPTATNTPTAAGHVTDVRRGCVNECAVMCPLVTINVERALASSDTKLGPHRYRLMDIEHAD